MQLGLRMMRREANNHTVTRKAHGGVERMSFPSTHSGGVSTEWYFYISVASKCLFFAGGDYYTKVSRFLKTYPQVALPENKNVCPTSLDPAADVMDHHSKHSCASRVPCCVVA
jgi:hypothetical protein